jgi:AraC family transcriptional regulator of adaptative response/methylated-DNA-[protein]-cysteine methyltransferase
MMPSSFGDDYSRIEQTIHFLDQSFPRQPRLAEVARSVNLSEFHFQRLFKRWAGLSPKRFLQYLSLDYARRALDESPNVLQAADAAGLSGPGRLHDLFVSLEAVTPGEFKRKGEGLKIVYGFHPTPFGDCALAVTPRGISDLIFVSGRRREAARQEIQARWPNAALEENSARTRPYAATIFGAANHHGLQKLPLLVKSTNFQIKVWEALLRIPPGAVATYEDVAAQAGRPGAARATGQAIGSNPIAFLIPCHRVIRKIGVPGGYRWGTTRKRAMLAWEAARHTSQ